VNFREVGKLLKEHGCTLAVMESCTGGFVSAAITSAPGCGQYFIAGLVSYATAAKRMLGVDGAVIRKHGVVSREVAIAMANAARQELGSDIGIGVTGVMGRVPQDGVRVGIVWIAVTRNGKRHLVKQLDVAGNPPRKMKALAVAEAASLVAESLSSRR
jgi:PncC family amidohydrolase